MRVRRAGLAVVLLNTLALSACAFWADVGDAGCDEGATGPGGIVGFDRSTGEELWTRAIGWSDGAVVVDDVLVVSTKAQVVRGIDIGTGDVVWCKEFESEFEDIGGVVSAGPFVATLASGDVVALDPATGLEQWRRSVATSESKLRGGDLVWVSDGSAAGGMLAALDGATGADVPDASGPAAGHAARHRDDLHEVVVVPNGTELHAIDPNSGAELWTVDLPSPGQGGSYADPGGFWFAAGGEGTTTVAVGYAKQPYRG